MTDSRIAEKIASYINSMGIGRCDAVILKMSRSERLLSAVFGIMRSGAALVPVEPDIPSQRLEVIRKTCNAALVIDDAEYTRLVSGEVSASLCDEETFSDEDTALILFTSGSTGIPKGVCHTRRSFKRLLNVMGEYFSAEKIDFGDVISLTKLSFVSSFMFELGPALFFDKRIVMAGDEEKDSVSAVSKLIETSCDPLVYMTPSKYLAFSNDKVFCEKLRKASILFLAGEKLDSAVEKKMLSLYPESLKIFNVYASTECGVMFLRDLRSGKYFENGKIALVDGEICAVDKDRFSCYLGGAEKKTVEYEGTNYIRTGDFGKRRSDGSITVLGRSDRMIKLHGLRIELDEIEWNIKQVKGIGRVAVVFDNEKQQIHCFYSSDSYIDDVVFINTLKDRLPYYMIPSVFHLIDELPLNSHGKVDYPKLKKITRRNEQRQKVDKTDLNYNQTDPKTKLLIDAVKKVLGIEAVSPSDSLRALGMDSLKGIELVDRMLEQGYSMKLSDIFLCADIKEISGKLKKNVGESSTAAERKNDYRVTSAFLKYIIDRQLEGNNNLALWCEDSIVVRKVFTESQWRERADIIQRKHPALRSVFSKPDSSTYIQRISPEPVGKVDYFDLAGFSSDNDGNVSAEQKKIIDSYIITVSSNKTPSNINENVTLTLFKISEDYSVIFMFLSHVIADGTSVAILRKELSEDNVSTDKDCFYEYMAWREAEQTRQKALEFNRAYLKGAFPAVFPAPERTEKRPWLDFHPTIIDFGSLNNTGSATPFAYVADKYGKAAMKTLNLDSAAFQIVSSGRNVPVCGMSSLVSGLAHGLMAVMEKGESNSEFIEKLNQAENCFCMPDDELVRNLGSRYLPLLQTNLPVLVSEIFPDLSEGRVVSQYREPVREITGIASYLFRKGENLYLQVSYNGTKTDAQAFESFLSELRNEIREDIT